MPWFVTRGASACQRGFYGGGGNRTRGTFPPPQTDYSLRDARTRAMRAFSLLMVGSSRLIVSRSTRGWPALRSSGTRCTRRAARSRASARGDGSASGTPPNRGARLLALVRAQVVRPRSPMSKAGRQRESSSPRPTVLRSIRNTDEGGHRETRAPRRTLAATGSGACGASHTVAPSQ